MATKIIKEFYGDVDVRNDLTGSINDLKFTAESAKNDYKILHDFVFEAMKICIRVEAIAKLLNFGNVYEFRWKYGMSSYSSSKEASKKFREIRALVQDYLNGKTSLLYGDEHKSSKLDSLRSKLKSLSYWSFDTHPNGYVLDEKKVESFVKSKKKFLELVNDIASVMPKITQLTKEALEIISKEQLEITDRHCKNVTSFCL